MAWFWPLSKFCILISNTFAETQSIWQCPICSRVPKPLKFFKSWPTPNFIQRKCGSWFLPQLRPPSCFCLTILAVILIRDHHVPGQSTCCIINQMGVSRHHTLGVTINFLANRGVSINSCIMNTPCPTNVGVSKSTIMIGNSLQNNRRKSISVYVTFIHFLWWYSDVTTIDGPQCSREPVFI